MCRLYSIVPKELGLKLELINFRFVPPKIECLQLKFSDFEAAYQRVHTNNKIQKSPRNSIMSPRKVKTFSQKRLMSPRSPRKASFNSQMLCLIERQITQHISVFIDFHIFEKYIQVVRVVYLIRHVELRSDSQ